MNNTYATVLTENRTHRSLGTGRHIGDLQAGTTQVTQVVLDRFGDLCPRSTGRPDDHHPMHAPSVACLPEPGRDD